MLRDSRRAVQAGTCTCPACTSIEADESESGPYLVSLTTGRQYRCRGTRRCTDEPDGWLVLTDVNETDHDVSVRLGHVVDIVDCGSVLDIGRHARMGVML